MIKDDILVSIVMPAYNAFAYISEAICSVIEQTWDKWELIIVDDGSTDNTWQIVCAYADKDGRIQGYQQKHRGGCAARNEALGHVLGDYVLFLDADDLLDKDKITSHLREIEKHNYLSDVLTLGSCVRLLSSGECLPPSMASLYRDYRPTIGAQVEIWEKHFNSFPYSSYLIPKALVQKAGLWDEGLSRSQDSEYMARILSYADALIYIPDAVFYYRQVENSVSTRTLTDKQLSSEVLVCDKISDLILAADSSQRAKHACEVHYTDILTAWYPRNRFLVPQIQSAMYRKGLQLNFENRGKLFHLLYRFLGWRVAIRIMRLKHKII